MSQFSLGVSGIKPETANQVEAYALDMHSTFFPGLDYLHLLDYPIGTDHDVELYNRLTDTKNHYYQYLYTALFIKELNTQWQNAGFDLSYRPDIIATIFNLGFYKSKPSDHPEVGGAIIRVGDGSESFGQLAYEFYFSGELFDQFPY